MASKNGSGSICYGADSDETSIFWVNGHGSGLAGMTPASVKGANDFGAGTIAGTAPCDGYPVLGSGSTKWNAL
jgi:hypothetical protein